MSQDYSVHYVCTHEEARKLASKHDRFWVSNCGCRESKGGCPHSRTDICMIFRGDIGASGSGQREISLTEVLAIFEEAAAKHLVARPYRNDTQKDITDGICFCCPGCCGYFAKPDEDICDKGKHIQKTDMALCSFCCDCVPFCYFNARQMVDDVPVITEENCYGCGLCAEICSEKAVQLVTRLS